MTGKITFIDYGYFYDLDSRWYYIIPGPFRIKMSLELIEQHVNEDGYEFEYIRKVEDQILRYILIEYADENSDFRNFLERERYCRENVIQSIEDKGILSVMKLYKYHKKIFEYFEDWILIKTNDMNTEISDIVVRKKEDKHVETYQW